MCFLSFFSQVDFECLSTQPRKGLGKEKKVTKQGLLRQLNPHWTVLSPISKVFAVKSSP